ncbi:phenylacetate--CoA ligase family protein [Algibacter lectus]|uniref:Possible CapK protein n=1 Tax=Algibacter lectus TaxID=221126 RepID=A0A090VNN6_9FLAO|nr:phenylacetate--CoA ligase family protein [Algibacter lectus]GAL64919.1 possible CapK protein [Algibacter lectus]
MANFKEKIYESVPHSVQNLMITFFNITAYRKRYSKNYSKYLSHYKANNNLTLEELLTVQKEKYSAFISYTLKNSDFYKSLYKDITSPEKLENLKNLPIINKEMLRHDIDSIHTINKKDGYISKTGGTTGKSLEVLFLPEDIEERFAILDNFRNKFGYTLGKKTAWFSGKNLLTKRDLKKNRLWKTDYYHKVRYYSTFHIHEKYMKYYIENLIKFQPEYLVGFPSTMYEIAKYGKKHQVDFPENTIKAIFPTAETITPDIRAVLESFFKTSVYNQYASSEGAPFIIECKNKNLHLELQSGVFEVLDDQFNNTNKGKLVVTAFHTHGTPLIRYDIGDAIELKEGTCNCGNNNPLVKEILGRVSDYIYSEETGKINLGNISNCLKGVKGIIKFQIQQHVLDKLVILIVKDETKFSANDEKTFLENLRARVGTNMELSIAYTKEIPVEKSGKFRLVKNFLPN